MKRLWAPWRLKYVKSTGEKSDTCAFCIPPEDPTGEEDSNRLILHRGRHSFIIMNLYPYNNGHILIAPYRHTSDLTSLSEEERGEIMYLITRSVEIVQLATTCHGFNIGLNLGRAAGAGIADHLHFHMVPRWSGDANFMPVIGETKVIPQSLEDSYACLKQAYKERLTGNE